jgi:RNA polymerase sigma-70 factor (ECF subfamily)
LTINERAQSTQANDACANSLGDGRGHPHETRHENGDEAEASGHSAAPGAPEIGTSETDEMLVDRVRTGDRAAFDQLYLRYFKRVYGFLDKRLRNRADTEETTQEVFINIFRSIDTFRGEAPFAAWVFGLTRRTLSARFKRKSHPTVPLLEEDDDRAISNVSASVSSEPTPLEHYEMVERANHFRQTLESDVTAEQRELFDLHHMQSMPIAEIARTLSKSEDSVKSNLYRTRKLLLAR